MIVVLVLFILIALYKHFISKEGWEDSFISSFLTSLICGFILTIAITLVNGFTGRYDRTLTYYDIKEVRYHKIVVYNPNDSITGDSTIVFRDPALIIPGEDNQVKREKVSVKGDWVLTLFGGYFFDLTTDVTAIMSEENIEKYKTDTD